MVTSTREDTNDDFGDMSHVVSTDTRAKFQSYAKKLESLVADLQSLQSVQSVQTIQSVKTQSTNKKSSNSMKTKPTKDDRTSKGRGVKLVTIPKLVNFCAATPERIPWDHERRDELFKSVFQY